MTSPKAIDLFSGAGGLALGLRQAGFEIVAALESDPWAGITYRNNIGDHLIQKDIKTVSVKELLDFSGIQHDQCDLLVGGPPCQGFSVQRRGSDEDPRNGLVLEFLRFVEGIRPRIFMMENVSGLMSKRGRPFLDALVNRLTKIGYSIQLTTLDAVEFGVPQYRRRVIVVGELTKHDVQNFIFPKGSLTPAKYRTVKHAIADLPSPPEDGSPHKTVANHARESRLSPTNLERLKHIPPGGGREHLPASLQLPCHINNPSHRHMDVYGRLAWDQPSGTVTARFDSFTRGRFAHPIEHRSITLREGARLQTFPDNFIFVGNREEVAKQIGNAVPPLLAKVLGKAIIEALKVAPRPMIVPPQEVKAGQFTLAL